ncbi:hypothetical protein [Antarcticirhabdus aurantiaca]|uniref:Uncharacterized protein n=1 Tax=Antarcticirhabdus aurantiaca TaxID=2606717 RepID=A0ACD4NWN9_9HYPH|nr:hypothetical protein [Antarcticirhabdus aurantiaca]WAJ31178.1 hypothetical protein OXU80_13645 [Jeongeuplla avenae]
MLNTIDNAGEIPAYRNAERYPRGEVYQSVAEPFPDWQRELSFVAPPSIPAELSDDACGTVVEWMQRPLTTSAPERGYRGLSGEYVELAALFLSGEMTFEPVHLPFKGGRFQDQNPFELNLRMVCRSGSYVCIQNRWSQPTMLLKHDPGAQHKQPVAIALEAIGARRRRCNRMNLPVGRCCPAWSRLI